MPPLFEDQNQNQAKPVEPKQTLMQDPQVLAQIGELSTRLRLLEERYTNLRRKTQLTEQNLIHFDRDFNDDMKLLHEQVNDYKREIQKLKDKIDIILGQISEYARSEDVKVMAKYLEFVSPGTLLTKKEAARMIEDALNKR